MSTPLMAAPPAPGLSPEWQDWLAGNVVRGCTDADLLRTMRESGFDEHFSRVAIAVVRSMTERVQAAAPGMLSDYQADPIRLPAGVGSFRAADREVGIGMVLSNPNVAVLVDLLSADECDDLIRLSRGRLQRSHVVDRQSGGNALDAARTSDGMYFQRGENALVDRIERRIAALSGIPADHGEGLQILRYGVGAEYKPHHDYFDPADPGSQAHLRTGGQRVATVVVYLNDVAEGGDTIFPELELSVRARKGSAAYFEFFNRQGQVDSRLLHGGAPVVRGEKWIATKWLRQSTYGR